MNYWYFISLSTTDYYEACEFPNGDIGQMMNHVDGGLRLYIDTLHLAIL